MKSSRTKPRKIEGYRFPVDLIARIAAVGIKRQESNRAVVELCVVTHLPVLEKECGIIAQAGVADGATPNLELPRKHAKRVLKTYLK